MTERQRLSERVRDRTLDADLIHRSMSDDARQRLDRLDVLDEVPSTNTWLLQQCAHGDGRFEVVLTDHQTAGRGRLQRTWHSPPGSGLCLSMSYTFGRGPARIASLTLVIGVAVARALERLGVRGHRLKWPNDIMAAGGKLGGILTDVVTGRGRRITVVTGVGLNIDLGSNDEWQQLDQPVTDLRRCMEDLPPRSAIAAAMIEDMQRAILGFEAQGLEPFRQSWNSFDWLKGKETLVEMPDGAFAGVADGIDTGGALRILTEHGRRRVFTGTVRAIDDVPARS